MILLPDLGRGSLLPHSPSPPVSSKPRHRRCVSPGQLFPLSLWGSFSPSSASGSGLLFPPCMRPGPTPPLSHHCRRDAPSVTPTCMGLTPLPTTAASSRVGPCRVWFEVRAVAWPTLRHPNPTSPPMLPPQSPASGG